MPATDWGELFGLSVSPVELFVRGSAIYWFLFLVFRLVLRRDTGSMAVADVLLLVIIADAAQNAMSGEYRSITDGFVLIGTIIFWNVLLDWAAYRVPALERIVQPRKLQLVADGKLLEHNLRREFITREELMAKLREYGVDTLAAVKSAWMEANGRISVIRLKDTN